MTDREKLEKLFGALKRIARDYQSPRQLERSADKQWGLGYIDALEMAYENIQAEAKTAIKGMRIAPSKSVSQ